MKIRKVEIRNYKCIERFSWCPSTGINCLIGFGDSGKSTVLDAIDFCLGARRTVPFSDSDFFKLDVESPISITLTIGDLDDSLKNLDTYGLFLRSFDHVSGKVEDEPDSDLETVLTVNLTVGSDLDPVWSLQSDRASEQSVLRGLAWKDRVRLAPARIGALASYNLGWRQGSVLNKLTEEKAHSAAALANAARQARETFGADADEQLKETLRVVAETAEELGVDVGGKAHALLDAHSISFGDGSVTLHSAEGIPLRGLGVGSTRLLIAGLQRKAADKSPILLVDEVEYGLEPHRIIRFLGSLGAKDTAPPFQVFMTTHSPVVLRELSGRQLYVLRNVEGQHGAIPVGGEDDVQGTIRCYPDAFLASTVLVCEGASEAGLVRGLDLFAQSGHAPSIFACGTALVDAGGVSQVMTRALAFQKLGYRVGVFRDDDRQPPQDEEQSFVESGGVVFKWRAGEKTESELFKSLPALAVSQLLHKAVALHGSELVDSHLRSVSNNALNVGMLQEPQRLVAITNEQRGLLARASTVKNSPWFKTLTIMEEVGREIVGPHIEASDLEFKMILHGLLEWARNAR
ncbi:MAG: AAA family ATPase [Proteobacteria bacterium]|nr:AAA family ATPase [Pseudomonadota bacterium]